MKIQRYIFEKVGDGYQFTTTDDGLWVMAKDMEELERELAELKHVLECVMSAACFLKRGKRK
jgi:hypothetical protein